jgi:hypothetical protein
VESEYVNMQQLTDAKMNVFSVLIVYIIITLEAYIIQGHRE